MIIALYKLEPQGNSIHPRLTLGQLYGYHRAKCMFGLAFMQTQKLKFLTFSLIWTREARFCHMHHSKITLSSAKIQTVLDYILFKLFKL